MNLVAYDKIKGPPTKSSIYSYNNYPYIITREVRKRKYYCYVTRYEPSTGDNLIFLVLLDDKPTDRAVAKTRQDNYGRLKFNLSQVGHLLNIPNNAKINIRISAETNADDGDIYRLDIESE